MKEKGKDDERGMDLRVAAYEYESAVHRHPNRTCVALGDALGGRTVFQHRGVAV